MGSPKCRPLKTKAPAHRKAHPTHALVQLASQLVTCQGPHIHAGQLLSWHRPPAGQEAFGLAALLGWPGGFWPGKATRLSQLDGFCPVRPFPQLSAWQGTRRQLGCS